MTQSPFFQLLRVAVGRAAQLERPLTEEEWLSVFNEADRQALYGVLFDGVERLPKEQRPGKRIIMKWYFFIEQLKEDNALVNRLVEKVLRIFSKDGLPPCILKGQGNALLYPHPERRNPGDIDVWVNASPRKAVSYVHRYTPGTKACYHHVDFPVDKEVEVEVHYRPTYLCSPLRNARLQRMFGEMAAEQFDHRVPTDEEGQEIVMPTPEFNALFQLVHLFRHIFEEGVGLRQLVDYFYVLQLLGDEERGRTFSRLRRLGLTRFAGAVAYVMREVFDLEEEYQIVKPHERCGRFLLEEIMLSGNFGQHDSRYDFASESQSKKFVRKLRRNFRFVTYYPEEVLCEPPFRLFHWCYRRWLARF